MLRGRWNGNEVKRDIMNSFMNATAQICSLLVCFLLGGLGVTLIVLIWTNKIDLKYLVSEEDGSASISRFQLLIFTFVVAIGLFKLVEVKQQFPEIPNGVLTLLGISASTYAVGKGISFSRPADESGDGGSDNGSGDGQ